MRRCRSSVSLIAKRPIRLLLGAFLHHSFGESLTSKMSLAGCMCKCTLEQAESTHVAAGLNKSMRSMARNSTVINACFPLSIQPIEVPRYRAVNEEVPLSACIPLNRSTQLEGPNSCANIYLAPLSCPSPQCATACCAGHVINVWFVTPSDNARHLMGV